MGIACPEEPSTRFSRSSEREAALEIGLSPLQGQATFDETLRECEQAEAAGFSSIWLGEHHNHPLLVGKPESHVAVLRYVFVAGNTERPLARQAIRLSEHLRGCISDGPILSSNALQAGSQLNAWLKTGLSWATPKAALRISSGFKQSWVRTISSAGSRFREFPAISAPSRSASLRAR